MQPNESEKLQREAAGDGEGDWSAMDRVYNFLMGISDLDGASFGEDHPKVAPGRYWWRHDLAAAYVAARKSPRPTGTDGCGACADGCSGRGCMLAGDSPASAEPGEVDPVPWRCPHCINRGIKPCPHSCENWRKEVAEARGGGEAEPWSPAVNGDYDRSIHANPDASAWADFFIKTFPGQAAQRDLILGWFANAMMAMHDHLKASHPTPAAQDAESVWREVVGDYLGRFSHAFKDVERMVAARATTGADR
jgi:hypothetical protein